MTIRNWVKFFFNALANRRSCNSGHRFDCTLGIFFAILTDGEVLAISWCLFMDDFPWIHDECRRSNGLLRLFDGPSIWRQYVQDTDIMELGTAADHSSRPV